jgi:hypothetical protein
MNTFSIELKITFKTRAEDTAEYYLCLAKDNEKYKQSYLNRAMELMNESPPTHTEIFNFLSSNIYDDPTEEARYISLAKSIVCYRNVYDINLFIRDDNVFLSFNVKSNDTLIDIKLMVEGPYDDSYYEGAVGNEMNYPSKTNSSDLLGVLDIDFKINNNKQQ